jgi:hypothetical protein
MKRVLLGLLSCVVIVSAVSVPTSAVAPSEWKPGSIIDDLLFANGRDMSTSEIQAFLVNLLPTCDISGAKPSELGGGTRAQYGASVGNPAPFTCITNYYEVPKTSPGPNIPENNYGRYNPNGSTYIPPGSKSAAQLIADAAAQYSINPKALLIKLATESAGPLTSDQWPLKKQYYYAMGAHCPDSGPGGSANCDINYSGFSMQIAESAKLLRGYLDNMQQSWWTYKKPFQNNSVLWNVAPSGCGAGNVYIETKATAALYTYTPYQPNQAALNNMYGTGNGCSAYGNRNFWRSWNDWFGTTRGTPFFQFPGNVSTYVLGANNTYYSIANYERLKDLGFETIFGRRVSVIDPSTVSGMTYLGNIPAVIRFEGAGVFIPQNGALYGFPSEDVFHAYGYEFGQEANLPKWMGAYLSEVGTVRQVMATSDASTIYYVANGKKQAICNQAAFNNLGSPAYSSQPLVALRSFFTSTIPDGPPIAMDGDVIVNNEATKYGAYQSGIYYPIDKTTATNSGLVNCGVPQLAVDQLTQAPAIGPLVKDGANNYYVIDTNKKLGVDAAFRSAMGLTDGQFAIAPSTLLGRLQTTAMSRVVRTNSDASVYMIRDGKKYGVPSPTDLYGLGYDFPQVLSISQQTINMTPYGGIIAKPGRVVRVNNGIGVYLLDTNFKMYGFPSENVFLGYGYSWSEVQSVPQSYLDAYTLTASVSKYATDGSSNLWLIDNGVRRKVTPELANASNFNATNPLALSDAVIAKSQLGSNLTKVFRAGNDPGVYMIENGKKRGFASQEALFAHGFNWTDVQSLSQAYINTIPSGEPIFQ